MLGKAFRVAGGFLHLLVKALLAPYFNNFKHSGQDDILFQFCVFPQVRWDKYSSLIVLAKSLAE